MYDGDVQKKSIKFASAMILLYRSLCKDIPEIASQILRSGTSIGANISEAQSAESKKDFIHKLSLALKEARETHFWLQVLEDSNIVIDENLLNTCNDICALLTASIKTLQKKR